ncbi:DinB family protein [Ilyomonas limi]|uniref:DinB family protein n=1 Tax=Ilyomonas limi TaxID=2575867 RepID=A0A4U3KWY1_9BACT|nr:DinB family protein [Ilyomonas limi]TKK65577.1 DinB family protein [Ilyomonas limi]
MNNQNNASQQLKKELATLLTKSHAHVSFDDAIKDIPFEDLGKKPNGVPYSIWQQVEHIRIAQKDILDFSVNKNYRELNWPADYWVEEAAPTDEAAWNESIGKIQSDLNAFIECLQHVDDVYAPFKHGSGQSWLREALVLFDHNSYHLGEIIALRRLLDNWKSEVR